MSKEELIDDESITASQEVQLMNVIIPLDDCIDCHVQLTRCQIDLSTSDQDEDVDESEESTGSSEEEDEEEEEEEEDKCTIVIYDEYDISFSS